MKAQGPGQRAATGGGRKPSTSRLRPIPIEWMAPMSWRLPSGKALAEFALQAGFLAPLMLSGPSWKRTSKVKRADPAFDASFSVPAPAQKETSRPVEEDREPAHGPAHGPATGFRETR